MRTKNSAKNLIYIFVAYIIIGVLGFIKARVFLDSFNEDIYSINQLFFQIVSYFSLAEAGVGVYLTQKYYKLFTKKDYDEINNIFGTQLIYYRKLGIFIISVSVLLSFIVPYLTKANVSSSYISIVFIVFVIKNSIDYFMSCPRNIIEADQKNYKINILVNGARIAESVIEIVLACLGVNYLLILLPGIVIRIVFNLLINNKIYSFYSWLIRKKYSYNRKYLKGVTDLIYQRVAGIIYSNVDILLLSSFVNPISVVIYSSYYYITKFITDTITICGGAILPSFANLVYEEDKEKSYEIFSVINTLFLFIASFLSIVLYFVFTPFVSIWMGSKYILASVGVILFIIILFNAIASRMSNMVVMAKGFFKEMKMSVLFEAMINLGISVLLVNKLGIVGVLIGTLVSTLLTTFWYQPYFVYKNVLNKSFALYIRNYLVVLLVTFVMIVLLSFIPMFKINDFTDWILSSAIYCVISFIVLFTIFNCTFKSFRNLLDRLKYLLNSRKEK